MPHWLRENHEVYMPHNAANVLKQSIKAQIKGLD